MNLFLLISKPRPCSVANKINLLYFPIKLRQSSVITKRNPLCSLASPDHLLSSNMPVKWPTLHPLTLEFPLSVPGSEDLCSNWNFLLYFAFYLPRYWDAFQFISRQFFSVGLQSNSGPGRLIVEVSRSHTDIHTTSKTSLDELFREAANNTTHNKHKRRTAMPLAGLEPAIPAI
jgi:hypothetical protein